MAESLEGRPAKRARLLSGDSGDEESGDEQELLQPSPHSADNGFSINKEYAKRFEHNKKREERHRLEEKYGSNSNSRRDDQQKSMDDDLESSSDSESEDDVGEFATEEVDAEILATLQAIRSKDARVYDKESTFYAPVNDDAERVKPSKQSKEKPVYLQDYHRANILNGTDGDELEHSVKATYAEEQRILKQDLINQMHEAAGGHEAEDVSEEEDFLTRKPKAEVVEQNLPKISQREILEADRDPETFLSNFIAARAWVPTASSRFQAFDSDDDAADHQAEEFEEAWNMRFEDPEKANAKLISHSRQVAAAYSVRREEPTGRKKTREMEKERKTAAKAEKEAEKARLRNLRIEEAQDKLKKFKKAAGLRGDGVSIDTWSNFLNAGWDSEKWDQEMLTRFGDDYYAEEEASGSEEDSSHKKKRKISKPEWDDDIGIDDIVPDFDEGADDDGGFALSDEEERREEGGGVGVNGANEETTRTSKKASKKSKTQERAEQKREARKERRQIEELVDQRLAIDASLPEATKQSAKFRYRETSPSSFGLTSREILMADDAQLNSYVGLKKLAAFREAEKKRKDKKHLSKKGRLRQWRKDTFGNAEGPTTNLQDYIAAKMNEVGDDAGYANAASWKRSAVQDGMNDIVQGDATRKKKKRSRKGKASEPAQ